MTTLRKELREAVNQILTEKEVYMFTDIELLSDRLADAVLDVSGIKSAAQRREEAEKRIAEQRANRKSSVDFLVDQLPHIKEQTEMRTRVENALHRNLDWDSPKSDWNGYDKKLVAREKEVGQTIEGFMVWFNSDEFRKNGVIYLKPSKIEDWWLQAFSNDIPGRKPHAL